MKISAIQTDAKLQSLVVSIVIPHWKQISSEASEHKPKFMVFLFNKVAKAKLYANFVWASTHQSIMAES